MTRTLASPHAVIERSGSLDADHLALRREIDELEAELVVVGLPLSLNGRDGPAARSVRAEVATMRKAFDPIPIELYDERFTTVTAHQSMLERKVSGKARRRVVDKVAAAVLLQSYLDGRSR